MRRIKLILKRLAQGVVLVAGLSALGIITANVIWTDGINRELQKSRKAGHPMTPQDLVQEKIPPDKNGALIYEQAFKLLPERDLSDMQIISDFLKQEKRRENPRLWVDAERVVSRHARVIKLTEQAVAKPECQFRNEWGTLFIKLTSMSKRRDLVRLQACAAILSARDGKTEEAARYLTTGYRIAESFRKEPSSVNQLGRCAVLQIVSKAMRESLALAEFSDAQADDLFRVVSGIELDGPFRDALAAERVVMFSWISRWHKSMVYLPLMEEKDILSMNLTDEDLGRPTRDMLGISGIRRVGWMALEELYARSGHLGDQLEWLRTMDKYVEGVGAPYSEAKDLLDVDSNLPFYAVTTRFMSDIYSKAGSKLFQVKNILAMDRVLLLLTSHERRNGGYPESLNDLKVEIPLDPYGEKPFKYRRLKGGFLLYSVGPDQHDDGGVQPKPYLMHPSDKGDIVLEWKPSRN